MHPLPRRSHRLVLAATLTAALAAASAPAVAAAGKVYYVDGSSRGIDAPGRGSKSTPWKTIQYAVDNADASSTVYLETATYAPFSITKTGLSIIQDKGATAVVSPSGTTVQNVVAVLANGVMLKGFTVSGCVPNRSVTSPEDNGSAQVRIGDGTTGAVVDGLTIKDSRVADNSTPTQYLGCYGVLVHGAAKATIRNSYISHNGTGVFIRQGGAGIVVNGNHIFDNDGLIQTGAYAYGGVGVFVHGTGAQPGPVVRNNHIYGNVARANNESDGYDGGATEIYASIYTKFLNNTIYDNDDVFESGTGGTDSCDRNTFSGNTVSGRTSASTPGSSAGMYIRCAISVTGNTFTNLSTYAIDVAAGDQFAGQLTGLTVTGNTFTQGSEDIWVLTLPPSAVQSNTYHFTIDRNHYSYANRLGVFQDPNTYQYTSTISVTQWRGYGFDVNGTFPAGSSAG